MWSIFGRLKKPTLKDQSASTAQKLLAASRDAHQAGDLEAAESLCSRLVEHARAEGDVIMEAAGLQRRGVMRDIQGQHQEAEVDVRAALVLNRAREGNDGVIVRQDLYTLGIILSHLDKVDEAIEAFKESARIAGLLGEDDAEVRGRHHVATLLAARGSTEEAIAALWPLRPGGERRRTPSDVPVVAQTLAVLLLKENRFDDACALLPAAVNAIGYWQAKVKFGSIDQGVADGVLRGAIDLHLTIAQGLAEAGDDARSREVLDALERFAGPLPRSG